MVAFLLRYTSAFPTTSLLSRRILLQSNALLTMSTSPQYWNREESVKQNYKSDAPIIKQAKIISLSAPDDSANVAVNSGELPEGASLVAIGTNMDEFHLEKLKQEEPNVIFVAHAKVCTCVYVSELMRVLACRSVMASSLTLTFARHDNHWQTYWKHYLL